MLDILKVLLSCPSVTPQAAGIFDYITNLLEPLGFKIFYQEFGEGEEKVANFYASFGNKGPNLCFAGHIDVVPAGDEKSWRYPPFAYNLEKDKIYGRGTVDMKGAVACMLQAIIDWSKENREGKVSILLTADEEGVAKYGTKPMLKWLAEQGEKVDFAIVGEPTCLQKMGDIIKIGRRGSISFELTVCGKQGHVAYPDLAVNPNELIIKILNDLMNLTLDDGNEYFQCSKLVITSIDTNNPVRNVIPQVATAKFNIRYNNIKNSSEITGQIKQIVEKWDANCTLSATENAEPFLIEPAEFTNQFAQIIERICKVKPEFSTSGGTSDARFIKDYCSLLEFGLLNQTAHQIDEYTKISDLQKLCNVYYEAIKCLHRV